MITGLISSSSTPDDHIDRYQVNRNRRDDLHINYLSVPMGGQRLRWGYMSCESME